MAANEMTFNQAATFLNAVQRQVTGVASAAPLNTSEFAAVATTVLKTGFDPVMNAISQVLARTIFSIRPYSAKFRLAEISETAFGNHTRKLSIADKELVDDERYKYPMAYDATQNPANGDGNSVDMYKVRKPEILQTNFYGSQVWEDYYTLFRDQFECAFTSPSEMGRFVTMVTQNSMDKLTQYREDAGRAAVLNFIGGIISENDVATNVTQLGHRVIPLVTLYNAFTGGNITLTPALNIPTEDMRPFTQFVYSAIMTVSNLMEQRSVKFQTQITGKNVIRHTPKSRQKLFILEQFKSMFDMMGLANTYHNGYLILPGGVRTESIAYWQTINIPGAVLVNASRIGIDGTIVTDEANAGVVACLFDEEALGYATTQSWQAPTPFNAAGGYWNMFVHETEKVYNDHTEKGVVFTLA